MKWYIKSAVSSTSDETYAVKLSIARDKHARESQLLELIDHADEYLLDAILQNHMHNGNVVIAALNHYPEEIKGNDSYFHIMTKLAETTASTEVIDYIRNDDLWGHPRIRYGAASNLATPKEILEELVTDESSAVRHEVARNRNLPMDSLKKLLNDPSYLTRETAQHYYKLRGGEA